MWIALASLYLKVMAIFAMWPVHLYGGKFVFSLTAQYVVYVLNCSAIYTSLGKFYKLNMWIVQASFYLKVKAIFALPCSAVYFYEISKFSIIQ